MEEWHQKLHNNTSPDDVVICQALIAYLQNDLDITHYWSTLKVVPKATSVKQLLFVYPDLWSISYLCVYGGLLQHRLDCCLAIW